MAGSFNHVIEKPSGRLLSDRDICDMLECSSGDVAEAVEEMYGMIWYLAVEVSDQLGTAAQAVERARQNYQKGLEWSPGRAPQGVLDEEGEDARESWREREIPTYHPPLRKFPIGTIVVCRVPSSGSVRIGKIVGGFRTPNTQSVQHWMESKKRWAYGAVTYHQTFMRRARVDEIPEHIR